MLAFAMDGGSTTDEMTKRRYHSLRSSTICSPCVVCSLHYKHSTAAWWWSLTNRELFIMKSMKTDGFPSTWQQFCTVHYWVRMCIRGSINAWCSNRQIVFVKCFHNNYLYNDRWQNDWMILCYVFFLNRIMLWHHVRTHNYEMRRRPSCRVQKQKACMQRSLATTKIYHYWNDEYAVSRCRHRQLAKLHNS